MRRYTWFVVVLSLLSAIAGARAGTEVDSFISPLKEVWGGTNQTSYTTGDLLYASATNTLSKQGIGSATDLLTVSGGVPTWAAAGSGISQTAFYGDGSDGSITWDGTTTLLGMVPASNVYTLSRDVYLTSSTINNGVSIITNGWRVFATGTLTNNGTIQWNGTTGGTGTSSTGGGAGGALTTLIMGGSTAGGAGGGTSANGSGGTNGATGAVGGAGGHGASSAGATHTGGLGGTIPAASGAQTSWAYPSPYTGRTLAGNIGGGQLTISGGSGGGGGGGHLATSGGGGGGGSGGGVVFVAAKSIVNTNGTISANGGRGGNAFTASTTGGVGGGGGGGCVFYLYNTYTGPIPTATGGAIGATGVTTSATAGSDGVVKATNNNQ